MSALDRTPEARRHVMLATALRVSSGALARSTELLVVDLGARAGRALFAKLGRAAACVVAFGLGRWLAVVALRAGELVLALGVPVAPADGVLVACVAFGGVTIGTARLA